MTETLGLSDFLAREGVLIDVRSPSEFAHAHIPGAKNLPLFTDEERASVGTCYKQVGKEEAIELGLKITGPKLYSFVQQAKEITQGSQAKVYCFRGGMRSSSMGWLFNLSGISTCILEGGYKFFRKWALARLPQAYKFIILGGMTGSGKTAVLHALKSLGAQILDLEALASHRGSAYGRVGSPLIQPSNEHFENNIAIKLASLDQQMPIWIEDESRMIGTCHVPPILFAQMQKSPFIKIEIPFEERLARLLAEYGRAPLSELANATKKISKHLGGQRTKEVLSFIDQGNLLDAMIIVLQYYDRTYLHSLLKRSEPIATLEGNTTAPHEIAKNLIEYASTKSLFNDEVFV